VNFTPANDIEVIRLLLNAEAVEVNAEYVAPKGTPTARTELGELCLPLEGHIDVAAEKVRLVKERDKLQGDIAKTTRSWRIRISCRKSRRRCSRSISNDALIFSRNWNRCWRRCRLWRGRKFWDLVRICVAPNGFRTFFRFTRRYSFPSAIFFRAYGPFAEAGNSRTSFHNKKAGRQLVADAPPPIPRVMNY